MVCIYTPTGSPKGFKLNRTKKKHKCADCISSVSNIKKLNFSNSTRVTATAGIRRPYYNKTYHGRSLIHTYICFIIYYYDVRRKWLKHFPVFTREFSTKKSRITFFEYIGTNNGSGERVEGAGEILSVRAATVGILREKGRRG